MTTIKKAREWALALWNNDAFIMFLIFFAAFVVRFLYILQVDKVPMAIPPSKRS